MPAPPGNNQQHTTTPGVTNAGWTAIANPNGARTLVVTSTVPIFVLIDEVPAPVGLARGFPQAVPFTWTKDKPPGFARDYTPDPAHVALQVRAQGIVAGIVDVYWLRE